MANNDRNNRDRIYDDRDEGNRRGDHAPHDRGPQRSIDSGGMGQSGYAAGRGERDRALDPYGNQNYGGRGQREGQGVATDDRFTGRGGSDYNPRGGHAPERMGGAGQSRPDSMGVSRGGPGRGESTRTDPRHRHEHNDRSAGDRGAGPRGDVRGYGHQFSGNEGYDTRFDSGRAQDQGPAGFGGYGGNHGYDQGYGGNGGYGNRGYDEAMGYQSGYQNDESSLGGHGGQSMHGDYARDTGETQRGVWQTNLQSPAPRGQHRGRGPQGWTRSDDRIKELVCEALTDDEHIDATGIDVEVKAGDVTLLGMVPDRQTKRLAEDVVERISGVKDVTNQLKVSADERLKYGRAAQDARSSSKTDVQGDTASSAHTSQNGSTKDDKKARA